MTCLPSHCGVLSSVTKNCEELLFLPLHSACRRREKGDPEGQFLYGGALLYGEGVEKDRAAALEWLNKAASRGHLNAKELLESEERKSKPEAD